MQDLPRGERSRPCFPGARKRVAPSVSGNLRLGHAWRRASIPPKALPTLLSSLGAFCLFELRVFQTFLDNLRPICSGHGYPAQRAANTSVLARGVSGCLNSAFLGLFYTSCGPSFSGHGYPAQRAANTSCPRSDRFWLLELR